MPLALPFGRLWLFAPIAGYWLLAVIVVMVWPDPLDLLLVGFPLAALPVVACAGARRRRKLD